MKEVWDQNRAVQTLMNIARPRIDRLAANIRDDARALAPVWTGNLRNSIAILRVQQDLTRYVVDIGTNVEYATQVEFGGKRNRAKPYLLPSFDSAVRNFGSI